MSANKLDDLVDLYVDTICSGLPQWNYTGAAANAEVLKQKAIFLEKMNSLTQKGITDEHSMLRAMDIVIAKFVPDEHISIRINGEDRRAGTAYIIQDPELSYKIPPQENNNLAVANEEFNEARVYTLIAPSDKTTTAHILVATKEVEARRVGIVAIDSFMFEMSSEKVRGQLDEVADFVLKQSENWDDIIFDFRGNGGGDATIIKQIGERLANKKLEYADKIEVINKNLDNPNEGPPDRYNQKEGDKTFGGRIYVLQDAGNASATEGAIWMLRQMDNCTTIGENTHGAFAGGDVKRHDMGSAVLRLGNTYRERTMPNGEKVQEGRGIPPDIRRKSAAAYEAALSLVTEPNLSQKYKDNLALRMISEKKSWSH